MKYRREIDGLRAVAVVPVILFHAGFSAFSGGFVGVDVFFVISGYLITSILLAELEQGNFSIARFYERRARRILPALFVVMLACLPFAYMWMPPLQLKDFAQSLVAVVFFASNILFWREDGYFAASAELKPLLHTWSLAVEEQYYLLFPLFLLLSWRFGRKCVFWSVVAVAVFSLLLAEWGWRNSPSANFYLTPTRAWELLAGSFCAFLTVGRAQRSSNFLSAAGLALIMYAIFAYTDSTPFPSVYTLVPVVGTVLVILFASEGTWVARLLRLRGFVAIGLISYSAYLWHQPLFAFARLRSPTEPNHVLMGALAVTAMLLAWATRQYVEEPFRKRVNPVFVKQRRVFAASGAVSAVFLVAGLAGHVGNGFEWRLSEAARQMYATAIPSPMRAECHYGRDSSFDSLGSCEYFGESADVAIYGNSHGVELAYAIAEELQKVSRSIVHFTISECGAGYQRDLEEYCNKFYEDRLQYLLQNPQVESVILAYRAEDGDANNAASLVDLANYLVENGKNTVLVIQAPTLAQDISIYLAHLFRTGAKSLASRSLEDWRAENEHVINSLRKLRPQVQVLDLADYFCEADVCFAVSDGQALYFDDDHMSIFGARRAAPDIVRLLK